MSLIEMQRRSQFRHATSLAHRHGADFASVLAETNDPRIAACVSSVARGNSEDHRDSFRSVPRD